MKMTATRNALLTLGFTHNVQEPMKEVDAAEELARVLLAFVNAAPGIEASNWGGEELLDAARTALRNAKVLP